MTNLEALRNLFKAVGGSDEDAAALDSNADAINAIATKIGTTGGLLPAVTASDNGSVCKVANGAWGVGTDAT